MEQTTCQNEIASEEAEIDLIKIFSLLWQNKWLIIVITIFSAGLSAVYAFNLPNIYTAEATIIPVNSNGEATGGRLGSLGGLASLAGVTANEGGDTVANLAIIKSRKFIMGFIEENNLLPILYSERWDETKHSWKLKNNAPPPSLQAGFGKFNKTLLSISEDKKNALIKIKIKHTDPELSAALVNKFIERANGFLKNKAIEESNQSISYLKEQIKKTNEVGIQELLYKLLEKELQNISMAMVRNDYAFKVIDPALVPENKSGPARIQILLLGTFIGCIFSVLIMLVKILRDRNDNCK